jgi:hypothetical protein
VTPGNPIREWVTFEDPDDPGCRWHVDVTFLTSRWRCLFRCGCQGVLTAPAPELEQGCCSYGAHFTGEEDRRRVLAAADRLGPDEWQYASRGRRHGVMAKLPGGGWRTRLVNGACVFLNRPGFPTGAGCALHQLAVSEGQHPMATKPDVCWQLPLRRSDRQEEDGSQSNVLSEFARSGWGPGGDEFAWWCTEAREAFTGTTPVYRSMELELRAMVGDALYEAIAAYLDTRMSNGAVAHPAVSSGDTGLPGDTPEPPGSPGATSS